jgi:DNA-binding transcriptional regulator YbjK
MPDEISTRQRIKRAARRLFALKGVDAVAVRDILAAAGQKNASSLNYLFRLEGRTDRDADRRLASYRSCALGCSDEFG